MARAASTGCWSGRPCRPVPGDRIVGLRREDEEIEVHAIGCDLLASGIDADWLDLAWGEGSDGGAARIAVILHDVPGALGTMASTLGAKHANIVNLHLLHRDGSFRATNLLAKHDEKYMPPQVKGAMHETRSLDR